MPSGSSAVSAAPISVPSSIVPVVSTVTWAISGTRDAERRHRPLGADDRRLGLQQVLAGLHQDRVGAAVDQAGDLLLVGVAQRRVTARGRASAAWCRGRPSRAPSVGGRVSTSRRRPPGRARRRPRAARGSGRRCRTRRGWPGWRRTCWSRRRPRRRRSRRRGLRAPTSGRVTLRISLQPSRPSKSSRVRSAACSIVPIAPSATTTRSRSASRNDGRLPGSGMATRLPRGLRA